MKIVVVGDGKVGYAIAEELTKENHDITIIDNNAETLRDTEESLDITTLCGNGAALPIQKEAGVPSADLLIAATSSDEVNMLCCFLASKLGCTHTIARVRNPEYEHQLNLMREELGLSMFVNPESATAAEIMRLIAYPSSISVGSFVKGRADMVEIRITPESKIAGQKIVNILKKFPIDILICAVERGNDVFIPNGHFVIEAGDSIHICGDNKRIVEFLRTFDILGSKIKKVIIVGGGTISYYTGKLLIESGIDVCIIEKSHPRCEELCRLLPDALIIQGDGTTRSLLAAEGLGNTDCFIALTDIDEENLIVSMYAAKENVPKVISKLNRNDIVDAARVLGIESVVNPKHITATQIVRYVRSIQNNTGSRVKALYRIANDLAEVMEFTATQHTTHIGEPLKSITLKENTLVAALVHEGKVIVPHGDDAMRSGDSVIVVTTANAQLKDLDDIFAN